MVRGALERFCNLIGCSLDKGFYSPSNRKELDKILGKVVLPKKGKLSRADKEREYSEEFIKDKRIHPAVESSINALENHGLDRCPDHGIDGFKRYVALSVTARNIQMLGQIVQEKRLQKMRQGQVNSPHLAKAA